MERFERFKKVSYLPTLKFDHCLWAVNENGVDVEIGVGPIEKRGENLPSGKNIADYLDKKGRMNLLTFFKDHEIRFPTLFVIVQREVSRRVVEVGCERFFGLSGYISQPRRSMLGVRNYERIALLSFILRHVFIDANWVAEEYLKRCKAGAWKKENTVESLKCFNLECIINAVDGGAELPQDIDIEEYLASLEEATVAGVIEIDEDGNEDD